MAIVKEQLPEPKKKIRLVKVGDEIALRFLKNPEWDRLLRVRRDGKAMFPFLGRVHMAGKTLDELRNQLNPEMRRALSDPDCVFEIEPVKGRVVYVGGEVHKAGPVAMPRERMSVLEAIHRAGGSRPGSAVLKSVILARAGLSGVRVTWLHNLISNPDAARPIRALYLMPGDVVIVPDHLIERPGPFVEQFLQYKIPGGVEALHSLFADGR